MINFLKKIFLSFIVFFSLSSILLAEIVKEFQINGNKRVSDESIEMFSSVNIGDDVDKDDLNQILLYELYQHP